MPTIGPLPVEPLGIVHRKRIGRHLVYETESMDDRHNVVAGLDVAQRFHLLRALLDATHAPWHAGEHEALRREAFLTWIGLELLFILRERSGTQWGKGLVGFATEPYGGWRHGAMTRSAKRALRHGFLLNEFDGSFIDPALRRLNVPVELRRLKHVARDRYFDAVIFVPSTDLCLRVLHGLARELRWSPPDGIRASWVEHLRSRTPVSIPGWRVGFHHAVIPELLRYYGIGNVNRRRIQGRSRTVYSVSYLRLMHVVDLLGTHPHTSLVKLPWLRGRLRARIPAAPGAADTSSAAPGPGGQRRGGPLAEAEARR